MEREEKWINRWNTWIAPKPVKPGVFRRKEGGFLIRGRTRDPRTGKRREMRMVLESALDAREAFLRLEEELAKARVTVEKTQPQKIRFNDYAVSLFEQKIKAGDIKSAKSREKWEYMIRLHLAPVFGDFFIDRIARADVLAWRAQLADEIHAGTLHPGTANDRMSMFFRIVNAAANEYEWDRNPVKGIKLFDISEHPTYTEEEPNSLEIEETKAFLEEMLKRRPHRFAFLVLGLATGLRPSSLRPLRRHGKEADIDWEKNILRVRQSQTRGTDVMKSTKTGKHQTIYLPDDVMKILKWHVESHIPPKIAETSDLLFPSRKGGFLSSSALDKPFANVAKDLKFGKRITPRAMRRTYQDLARLGGIHDFVTRSISGHATEKMQLKYSSIQQKEMRSSIERIASLSGMLDVSPTGRTTDSQAN